MPFATWSDKFEIGIKIVDDQHRSLFDAFNAFYDAASSGKGKDEVGRLLNFLVDYTVAHFRDEEGVMAKVGFPDLKPHAQQHAALLAKVGEYKAKFEAGKPFPLMEVSQFIVEWLKSHMQKEDRAIALFMKERGL